MGRAPRGGAAGGGRATGRGPGGEKRLYWDTTFGTITVNEPLFGSEGTEVRPFCRAAGVRGRGYWQPLQRRMTAFGAELAVGQVPAKLQEH